MTRAANATESAKLAWNACERLGKLAPGACSSDPLTSKERAAATRVVRAAVGYLNNHQGRCWPKTFCYGGKRFYLSVSSFGRVKLGRVEGERVLSSGYGAV